MNLAQRLVAGLFALYLIAISFGLGEKNDWLMLAAMLAGMILALWAIRPNRTQ